MDDRGVSAVVGKLLEVALVVLYVGLLASTLFGGLVPEYQTVAGEAVSERTISLAATRIEATVPAPAARIDVRYRVSIPATIADASYRIETDGRYLVLDHPRDDLDRRTPLALRSSVTISGQWESGAPTIVRVRSNGSQTTVSLTEGTAP